jgi:predicted nucleotidyltransferase
MHTQAEVIEIINGFLKLINSEYPLTGVYLFGSYANGTAREYSDIDLAIISDSPHPIHLQSCP